MFIRSTFGAAALVFGSSLLASDSRSIETYLSQNFPGKVTNVSVGTSEIEISGTMDRQGNDLLIADVPISAQLEDEVPFDSMVPISIDRDGKFSLSVPRHVIRADRRMDRLTSRWQLFQQIDGKAIPQSHGRYADEIACLQPQLQAVQLKSKKGLGGWMPRREPTLVNEIEELGIAAVTVNIFPVHQFVSTEPKSNSIPYVYQGRIYHANMRALQGYDAVFREARQRGLLVSVILLVDNPVTPNDADAKLLAHPDAVRVGKFAMPNVTSTDGAEYYGAILDLMAKRWSREDGAHGRVHHWIIHNEVDFGWTWTNAGRKTDVEYMDLYHRSMRITDLIVRQYDPNARAWISLTHHWAKPEGPNDYGSKRMLELLARYDEVEGSFPWALAFHPYPQDLFNPRTWNDDQATFKFDSAKITPKNLEVLDAFMNRSEMRYRGEVRPVHLSENGFNSKDDSPESLEEQAAGMAMAWKKMSRLPSIQCWHYHNWIDNRHEGGLRIGLRKFPDDASDPLGKKPIWYLYQSLGTTNEDDVAEPYLKTIGIDSWQEIFHDDPIE